MQNFNFPYISESFSEFWQRWHISLSTFLKEYLYFPLGGNRKSKTRTYLNLFIVMVLGGLWHGTAWSYAVWGLAHGILLASERFLKDYIKIPKHLIIKIIKTIFVFSAVSFAWLLFKLPEFGHVLKYFEALTNNTNYFTNYLKVIAIFIYSAPVVIYHFVYLFPVNDTKLTTKYIQPLGLAFMLMLIILNSGSPQDFIYFQF